MTATLAPATIIVEFRPSKAVSELTISHLVGSAQYVGNKRLTLRRRYELDADAYGQDGNELYRHVDVLYRQAGSYLGSAAQPGKDADSRRFYRTAAAELARVGRELSDALTVFGEAEKAARIAAGNPYAWER